MGSSTRALSDDQLAEIRKTLGECCQGETCISRKALYVLIKDRLNLNLELYLFEQAITNALQSDKLPGFESRRGRSGGICKKGAFVRRDHAARKSSRPPGCTIRIGDEAFHANITTAQAVRFVTQVLNGKPSIKPSDIAVNSTSFHIPKTIEAKKVLANHLETLKAQRIEHDNEEERDLVGN